MNFFKKTSALIIAAALSSTALGMGFIPKKNLPKTDTAIELDTSNTVVLRGAVTDVSVSNLIRDIELNTSDVVYLYLLSPGGSVFAGMKAVSYIRNTPKKIVCITDVAISMAAVILSVCDERIATNNSIYMQHVAKYGIPQMEAPNAESFQKFISRSVQLMDIAQAARIGISYNAFKALTRNDWWLMGEDLVAKRVVDRAATVTCTRKAVKDSYEEVVATPFGELRVVWSACPILSTPQEVKAARFFGPADKQAELINKLNVRDNLITPFSTDKNTTPAGK